jgi:NADH:ubiquinone oxidoreductase subunit 2 (subunit N)
VLNNQINNIEYSLLCTYSLIGLIIILAANDFATIFLALELQSLSFYILSGFKKDTIFSVENGLKYFLLGSLSSSYFLLGWNLLYGFSGLSLISNFHILFFDMILPNVMKNNDMESIKKLTKKTNSNITLKDFKTSILTGIGQTSNKIITKLDQITVNLKTAYNLTINNNKCESLLTNLNKTESIKFSYYNYNAYIIKENFKETSNSYYESTLFSINSINKKKIFEYSLLLILISFFFKLAVAPFHSWSIDVYEGSPTSSTIFFATVTKISLFIVLIKIFYYGFYHFLKSFLYQFLINTSMLSVFLGSLTGITERKLKSLLAYSAINNTGYLLLAISIGTINGIKATIFYLIIYTSSSLAAWSGLISIKIIKNRHLKKESKDLSDIVMLRKTNPMLTALLILILFSSAGLPPFVGFVIKLEIFLTSIESSIFLISILIIITSILSTFYYLRIVKVICFEKILVGKLYKTLKLKQSLINCGISFFLVYQFLKPWFSILFSYKASVC